MRRSFPLLAALACTSLFNPLVSESAIAGPKTKAKPVEKPWAPLPNLPPGTVTKAGQTPQPAKATGCDGVRSEYFAGPRLNFRQTAGSFSDRLTDLTEVRTSLQVKVTASKRRLFLEADGELTGVLGSGGHVPHAAHNRYAKLLDIPEECEIASITEATGRLSDKGPPESAQHTLYGSGLIETAKCSHGDRSVCQIVLKRIEVRLRPATVTCDDVTISPRHMQLEFLKHVDGDLDLDGGRINMELDTTLYARKDGVVKLMADLSLKQATGDGTKFVGSTSDDIFVARHDAPGCRVRLSRETGRIRATTPVGTDSGPSFYGYTSPPGGETTRISEGILRSAKCSTDSPGGDHNALYCTALEYEPLVIHLSEDRRRHLRKTK